MQEKLRVHREIRDGVADVRMVRGDKHNGLDAAMFSALVEAAGELAEEGDLRAVVLSGEGPSFCAGLDFKAQASGTGLTPDAAFAREDGNPANYAQRTAHDWRRIPVPVIAALHGSCLGGGAQIALGADIRFAAPDLSFSIAEIRFGLIPDMSISATLPALVGSDVAKELIWTGRNVGANEALALGLVTHIADDPRAAALALAGEITKQPPEAIRAGKRLVDEGFPADTAAGLLLEEQLQTGLLRGKL